MEEGEGRGKGERERGGKGEKRERRERKRERELQLTGSLSTVMRVGAKMAIMLDSVILFLASFSTTLQYKPTPSHMTVT